ncbi:MAG: transcription repressor NadR [Eubacterium sp.]
MMIEKVRTKRKESLILDGVQRRAAIVDLLKNAKQPLSGTAIGRIFNVSRQVIVQDIALLRVSVPGILSTHRGYLMTQPTYFVRVLKVCHQTEEIENELNMIVDAGGRVIDVFVHHPLYGKLKAELRIFSRLDVKKFVAQVKSEGIHPLNLITGGDHYHTIEANSEEILDTIEKMLLDADLLLDEK